MMTCYLLTNGKITQLNPGYLQTCSGVTALTKHEDLWITTQGSQTTFLSPFLAIHTLLSGSLKQSIIKFIRFTPTVSHFVAAGGGGIASPTAMNKMLPKVATATLH